MIRISAEREGVRTVILVLEPDNVRRVQHGEPIMLDLQPLAGPALSEPLHLIIEAPADFQERCRELLGDARASGAPIMVFGKPAGGVQ